MYKLLPILLFAYGLAITTEDIYDNSYALIIGIDKYENVKPLNYAVKDAESIQDILVNTFDFPEGNITLLKNKDATKQNILQAFSDITTKARNNDRVLIYFAGHGETMDLSEGGEMGYLLPVDGTSDNLYLSSIGMDELEKISLISKAKHTLYLVDACYGGIAAVGSRGLDASSTPNYIDKITKNRAVQIITAGGRGEQVIEKPKWGHSAFTLNLNRGLKDGNADMNADGYITANELGMFLSEKVTIDSENLQTPQYGRMTSQEGEFVFVYSENTIINQNVEDTSADVKLDLLLSKVEKLESQKSSDDIVEEKPNTRKKGIWEDFNEEGGYGFGYNFSEDCEGPHAFYSLHGLGEIGFGYFRTKNNIISEISAPASLSISSHTFSMLLGESIGITDQIGIGIHGGANYLIESWNNANLNTSGKFNKVIPHLIYGINISTFRFKNPFPMIIGFSIFGTSEFRPIKYEIDSEGLVTLDDWKLITKPIRLSIYFAFPKNERGFIY